MQHERRPNRMHAEQMARMIRQAMESDLEDVALYSRIAKMMMDPAMRNIVLSMMADEYGHVRTWATMYHMHRMMMDGMDDMMGDMGNCPGNGPNMQYPEWGNEDYPWGGSPGWEERPPFDGGGSYPDWNGGGIPPWDDRPPYWGEYPSDEYPFRGENGAKSEAQPKGKKSDYPYNYNPKREGKD